MDKICTLERGCSSLCRHGWWVTAEEKEANEEGNPFFPRFFEGAKNGGRIEVKLVTVLGTLM